jgi:hypothetical protein
MMKVYMKPIRMIAWFENDGILTPIRFQMLDDNKQNIAIKIDKITIREEEKLAGNRMFIYKCQSIIDGVERIYELKYEINACKWFLWKM